MNRSIFPLALLACSAVGAVHAATELPHGCGTFVICEGRKDANDEPDGDQRCKNADNKKTLVIQAHWKNGVLENEFFCANDDGVPKVRARYKAGKLDGLYQEYDADLKQWAMEETYKNGKREGVSKRVLPNGKTIVQFFKNDRQYGYELVIDPNGKLAAKRNCVIDEAREADKVCQGITIPGYEKLMQESDEEARKQQVAQDNRAVLEKYGDGTVRERYQLVGGKKTGLYESFFRNGKPRERYVSIDGLKDGVREEFFEEGGLEVKTLYRRGERTESSTYFKEGQIESITTYKKDQALRLVNYYQNGKMSSDLRLTDGPESSRWVRVAYSKYHDNGQVAEKGAWLHNGADAWGYGPYDGEREFHSKDGRFSGREFYEAGQEVGTWTFTGPRLIYEHQYKKGVKLSTTVFDKTSRKQLKRVEFMPDGSTRLETVDPSFKPDDE